MEVLFHNGVRGGYNEVRYDGGPGEANDLELTHTRSRGWIFEDSGAPLTARPGCQAEGARVSCKAPIPEEIVTVALGDSADRLVYGSVERVSPLVSIGGGEGDDVLRNLAGRTYGVIGGDEGDDVLSSRVPGTLRGGGGDDVVTGSDRADAIEGGPGADTLRGGGGRDTFDPGADDAADLVDGGTGVDSLRYASTWPAYESMTIDLQARRTSHADALRSIENAHSGLGEDVVNGDGRANRLEGDANDDVIRGRGGNDVLDGGHGDDDLFGGSGGDVLLGGGGSDDFDAGPGDDRVEPWNADQPGSAVAGTPRTIVCGTGTDLVYLQYRMDKPTAWVPNDCERVQIYGTMSARPRIEGSLAVLFPSCPRVTSAPRRCKTDFVLSSGGEEVGRASARWRQGTRARVPVPLTADGRRLVKRGGLLDVAVWGASYRVSLPPAR